MYLIRLILPARGTKALGGTEPRITFIIVAARAGAPS